MQKADVKHSFRKLRTEALLTFKQAWSQPGGRPCPADLAQLLVADLTGSKHATLPAASDGLLKVMWDWTQACGGSGAASKSGSLTVTACCKDLVSELVLHRSGLIAQDITGADSMATDSTC